MARGRRESSNKKIVGTSLFVMCAVLSIAVFTMSATASEVNFVPEQRITR